MQKRKAFEKVEEKLIKGRNNRQKLKLKEWTERKNDSRGKVGGYSAQK